MGVAVHRRRAGSGVHMAAMSDADRLRNAAEVAPNGIWGWELGGLDVALDPENGGDIPVMVANLLLSAGRTSAGWWCPEGGSRCCPVGDPCALHADALDLAKAILGDTDD